MSVTALKPATQTPHAAASKAMVAIENVTMSFGSFVAVQDVNLTVADGEFVAIVGPTGCGKSTILNAIAGLLKPAKGSVSIDGSVVSGVQNNIGYLFQQDALLPWKTAIENVELGPMFQGVGAGERRERALKWLAKVGLKGFEDRYPHQLSGGQRKRVQMAQALITGPKVILMDEPFSALDIHTRHLMQNELLRLWQEERRAVVLITHDLEEAIALLIDLVLDFVEARLIKWRPRAAERTT
ncbi:ABC transporter ATP-binding protein [Rhizobium mayense]|uniref:ABC transporter ATP-binding protein n=1 Tax=Rhizobium mayense TaxID=1312184 RepID=UPI00398C5DD9